MEQGRKAYTVTRSAWIWMIVSAAAIVVGAGIYSIRLIQYGFSAREKPTSLEASLVRKARRWAIPAKAKHLKNPMPTNAEMLEHGRNHSADHCATCHANNGSGETEIGRTLCLVTMLSGFEINSIGSQPTIRSAITLPPCSTFFGSGSGPHFASFGTVAA
jgi:cytochrome c553